MRSFATRGPLADPGSTVNNSTVGNAALDARTVETATPRDLNATVERRIAKSATPQDLTREGVTTADATAGDASPETATPASATSEPSIPMSALEGSDAPQVAEGGAAASAVEMADVTRTGDAGGAASAVDIGEVTPAGDNGEAARAADGGDGATAVDTGEGAYVADGRSDSLDASDGAHAADALDPSSAVDTGAATRAADGGDGAPAVDMGEATRAADGRAEPLEGPLEPSAAATCWDDPSRRGWVHVSWILMITGTVNLWRWLARRPRVPRGASGFGYHQQLLPVFIVITIVSVIETVVVDVAVHQWTAVRIPLLVLGIGGIVLQLAMVAGLLHRPHAVGDVGIRVRSGAAIDLGLSWEQITSVERVTTTRIDKAPPLVRADGVATYYLRMNDATNLLIELERPTLIDVPRGPVVADAIALYADDPKAFLQEVRRRAGQQS